MTTSTAKFIYFLPNFFQKWKKKIGHFCTFLPKTTEITSSSEKTPLEKIHFSIKKNTFLAYFSLMIFLWKFSIFLKTTEITSSSEKTPLEKIYFLRQKNIFLAYFSLMIFKWKFSIFLKTTKITSLSEKTPLEKNHFNRGKKIFF